MRTMQVMLNIPLDEYQALTKIAEARQTQVHFLVERLVSQGLRPRRKGRPPIAAELIEQIGELAELHYSYAEIGRRLGVSRTTVGRYITEEANA